MGGSIKLPSVQQVVGAGIDPLNISGYGGIPGINSNGRSLDDLKKDVTGQTNLDRATDANTAATSEANAILRPYSEAGMTGMTGLQNKDLLGNFEGDPGYQFRLAQGNNAINSAMAARGLGNSGAALKALTRYGQDFASNEYNNAYGREFNRLSTLAGIGGNAATGISNNILGLANANNAARIAQGNQQNQVTGQIIQGGAMMFSDKRLKKDVELIPADEIHAFRANIRPYLFKYIDESYGDGAWSGVMAQDLEKSRLGRTIVVENEKGEKQIDIKKAVSLLLALEAGV